MIVTVWRHGQAEEGRVDRQRKLTGIGRDDVGFGCGQFYDACDARHIPLPDTILYSPWDRTSQTSEIIGAAFTHATASAEKALQPGSDVDQVDAALTQYFEDGSAVEHLLLVSHQPLVSRLVDHYLGERELAPSLSPGGLVVLSLESPAYACGTLRFWALPPDYEAVV